MIRHHYAPETAVQADAWEAVLEHLVAQARRDLEAARWPTLRATLARAVEAADRLLALDDPRPAEAPAHLSAAEIAASEAGTTGATTNLPPRRTTGDGVAIHVLDLASAANAEAVRQGWGLKGEPLA